MLSELLKMLLTILCISKHLYRSNISFYNIWRPRLFVSQGSDAGAGRVQLPEHGQVAGDVRRRHAHGAGEYWTRRSPVVWTSIRPSHVTVKSLPRGTCSYTYIAQRTCIVLSITIFVLNLSALQFFVLLKVVITCEPPMYTLSRSKWIHYPADLMFSFP